MDTFFQGPVPAWRDENGYPVVYESRREAELEIADTIIMRLEEFRAGNYELEDVLAVDDYVVEVDVWPDGSITDDRGKRFGKDEW